MFRFESTNENLTSQVSNANLISSLNKYNNNANDKRVNTHAIKLPQISEIVISAIVMMISTINPR